MQNNGLGLLGLCKKAGRMVSGDYACRDALNKGKTYVILLASDASEHLKRSYNGMCADYNIPCLQYVTKTEIGRACGRETAAVISINDEGFANRFIRLLAKD
ncbi:MAG: ribosomal L7Ae/L30e/S12e/Gadd45 family protein [Clostridia bacterium]|nr:ribosomal L7Ae/L30e/S12e/Gadd45 family protein [Clostridia bacterium]